MLQINLFHEQQQLQRERDFDPVRLTFIGGIIIMACTAFWALMIYIGMSNLRTDLASGKGRLEKLNREIKALGPLTDLPKTKSQAQTLRDHVEHRVLFATQLDILRDVIPANCQIRLLKTTRSLKTTETTVESKKGSVVTKTIKPTLEMSLEVNTRAKDKVEVLQIRDNLIHLLHHEPRFREWLVQTSNQKENSNIWNEVIPVSSTTHDPKAGEMAIGIFEFKLPFALKDSPKKI